MRLPRLLAGGAVLVALTGTAACGAQALEPRIALRDAFTAFTEKSAGAVELSIASSADEVLAFAESVDPEGGADIPEEDLETILSSSLDLAYDFGGDGTADDASSFLVRIDDLVAGEMRSVGEVAYARMDVDGLAERFPEMEDGLEELRTSLSGEDGVSEPAPAEVAEPANAFLDGKWISVDLRAYLEQLEQMGAGQDPEATEEMVDLLGAAVKDAVTSIERREGDEAGDHLVAKVDLRDLYATLKAELPGLYDDATAEALEQQLPTVNQVPDKQIAVSFWVRDGELQRAELDLAQFADDAAGSLVLRADLGSEREITAPDDAVEFDFAALTETAMAGVPGLVGEGEPGAEAPLDAYTVATWVDMDIASVAYEEGGQASVAYLPDVLPYYEGLAPDLAVTAAGERVQVALGPDVVCLTLSPDGTGEGIVPGPC